VGSFIVQGAASNRPTGRSLSDSGKKSTGVLAYPPLSDLKIMNFNKISILKMQVPAKFGF